MKYLGIFGLVWAVGLASAAAVGEADLALLRDAEGSRGGVKGSGISWIVDATNEDGDQVNKMKLRVMTQDSKVFAEVLEPENTKGTKYIVADGKMWYHKPNLSRPVPLSRRQRVVGKAAVGDIASMSFLNDYAAEEVEKGEHNGEACTVFKLVEKSKTANYPMIRYWVSTSRRVGVRAEFFTSSGARLRTATMKYDNRVSVGGEKRAFLSEMIVTEEIGGAKETRLVYGAHLVKRFSEDLFDYRKLGPNRLIGGPKK